MAFMKRNFRNILSAMFLIAIGILLLINPETFTKIIIMILGIFFIAIGIVSIIRYFTLSAVEAAAGPNLVMGLVSLCIGCICVFKFEWLKTLFPTMVILYGVLQIILGFDKIQKTIDMLRLKLPLWFLFLISAAISITLGIIIILNTDMTIMSIWIFAGISMIVEGILELISLTAAGIAERRLIKAKKAIEEQEEATSETTNNG